VSEAGYAEWMARGRNHQWEGRPLDATQCFQRAAREWPRGVEARFHLGEAWWKLGRLEDAVRAWREATRLDARFVAAWQALAEAALGLNDNALAQEAALQVLAHVPGDARALAVRAVAGLRAGVRPRVECGAELCAALEANPGWLGLPAIGGSLALALDAVPDSGGAKLRASSDATDDHAASDAAADDQAASVAAANRAMLDAIVHASRDEGGPARLHPRLLARVCEYLAAGPSPEDRWFRAMAGRPLDLADHDALRRAARAAARAGAASAPALAAAYAQLCAAAFGAAVPLLWTRRTAGARARVVLLVASAAGAASARGVASRLAHAADVTQVAVGDAEARRIAALDPDLLVDLAGLEAASGPLLAQRPARRIVTLAGMAAPNVSPLIDQALDVDTLVAAARAAPSDGGYPDASSVAVAGEPPRPSRAAPPDLATLDAAWGEAIAAHRAGERDAAAAGYARVLDWQPGYAPALYLQGALARERGEHDAARAGFEAALAAAPFYDDARIAALSMAGALHDAGAVTALSADVAPAAAPALLRACGLAWLALGDGGRAASFFDAALRREPVDAETHYNMGVALQVQRRHAEAARAYQRALACDPQMIAADFNLGVLFTEAGNRDGAIAAFGEVLRRDPQHVAAHKNLCEALLAAGRIDAWLAAFRRFEQQCPDALPMAVQALEACHYSGDLAGVDRVLEGLRRERYVARDSAELADALEQLLYLLLYFDVEPGMLHRCAETYDTATREVYGTPLPRREARAAGKLRIGYLSADLRNHVMGKMMYQAIARHDRDRFAVHLYSLSPLRDEWTARFEAVSDALVPLAALDDTAAVARIAEDDLDILVDLNTHTKGARPGILARKPARVQITHVASAGTLGLRAIDFKLTDRHADVAGNQAFQLETLLPMDGCVYPYRRIEPPATHPYRRDTQGIAADAIVIGAFVNPLKLSRRCLTLWREVLARVPRALLLFSPLDPALRDVYRRLVRSAGIDESRIAFVAASPDETINQARYALVDLVLDPTPFGGVNGTLEALDAGVPVVTLLGKRHGERTSHSILANLGVTSTTAQTGRDYVELAVRLAQDAAFRAQVRRDIQAGLAHSPLTDMQAHARHLEAAYVEALARACPQALSAAGEPIPSLPADGESRWQPRA
jgi:predicted O-linked N-acetylglucosamine transferase (SPINDLY family)